MVLSRFPRLCEPQQCGGAMTMLHNPRVLHSHRGPRCGLGGLFLTPLGTQYVIKPQSTLSVLKPRFYLSTQYFFCSTYNNIVYCSCLQGHTCPKNKQTLGLIDKVTDSTHTHPVLLTGQLPLLHFQIMSPPPLMSHENLYRSQTVPISCQICEDMPTVFMDEQTDR